VSYKRWSPNSRRDRRRAGGYRRRTSQGTDKVFFLVIRPFFLGAILILAALAFFTG
jgi:hypothetical protein